MPTGKARSAPSKPGTGTPVTGELRANTDSTEARNCVVPAPPPPPHTVSTRAFSGGGGGGAVTGAVEITGILGSLLTAGHQCLYRADVPLIPAGFKG